MWAGVDVGGRRKGFHAAVISDDQLGAPPQRFSEVSRAVAWLLEQRPLLVAVDSPRSPAPDGLLSRAEERELARRVCGIRYTPSRAVLAANPYYEWILHGFELYTGLDGAGLESIECFPTASWTRWAGMRGDRSRAAWTRGRLEELGLKRLPLRTNQDERDAIAAAVTARAFDRGLTESFGEIVVPR